jgi:eukaryotic-like serine/threonine-protein kinase
MSRFLNETVGDYRLIEFLGAGGMGEVYRGIHVKTGGPVAVKILTGADPEDNSVQRFRNEARIQSSLRHPGVATLFEFLEWRGRPTIVMEYVDGETLAETIATQGRIPVERTVSIGRALARTLDYVHSKGIIHRDLKCGNVKVDHRGQLKLLDFGIARDPSDIHLTRAGFLVGTFESLAPEQVLGQEASVATDIWALGIVLYQAVTGRGPFDGIEAPDIFARIAAAEYTPPSKMEPQVPRELDRIIAKCLRKRPAERYASALAVDRDLERIVTKTAPATEPAWRPADLVGAARSHPRTAAGALIVLALAVLLAVVFGSEERAPQRGTQTTAGLSAPSESTGQNLKTVTVDVVDGVANVYRDGRLVGRTPYAVSGRFGETVALTLRREGYADLPIQFDINTRSDYSYIMEPVRP